MGHRKAERNKKETDTQSKPPAHTEKGGKREKVR